MTRPILGAICFAGLMSEPTDMSWPSLIGWSIIVGACLVGFAWAGSKGKRDYDSIYKLEGERE